MCIVHILRMLCTLDILLIFSILMRKPSKMTITLLAKKGGVGKSSVCLLLHEAFKKVRRNTILGRLLEESAKQVGAPVLPVHLSARECYQHAMGQGWGALDAGAREEVLQLAVSLMSLSD